MTSSIIQVLFLVEPFIRIQPNMSKKRNDKESVICLTPKPTQVTLSSVCKAKKKFYRRAFNEKVGRGLKRKRKEGFLTALTTEGSHKVNKKAR